MTSKERVQMVLKNQTPDRVPFNFWMDRRLLDKYGGKYGEDFRVDYYGADVIETFADISFPAGRGRMMDGSLWYDEPYIKDWSELKNFSTPNASADGILDPVKEQIKKHPDKAVFVNIAGPLTLLNGIRLLDNVYMDVILHPEELHKLIGMIMKVQNEIVKRACELDISAVYYQDDIAASKGLILSPDMVKEFVFDYFADGVEAAKSKNIPLVYHSDGNVTHALDMIVELGFDAVNPMQPEYNDFCEFKEKFGGRLSVYGGIDNTKIIPYSSPKEIREHIEWIFDTLGKDGGLIMSSHDIPLCCPRENIEAMVEAIKECKYKEGDYQGRMLYD